MTAVVVVSLAAFAVWATVVCRTTSRRLDRDLPLLMDHQHQWLSEPGSAQDHCACGAAQVRRWTS